MLSKLFFISLLSSFIFLTHSCLDHQKTLLLQLKDELSFNSSLSTKLVRWNETDDGCCKWPGVACDAAGYVVSLQLHNESISGGIADSSSLFRLEYLENINLAYNKFNNTPIPKGLELPNLEMLVRNLIGLRELYLDYVNVTSSHERRKWSHIISSYLPNLTTLSLYSCGLKGSIPSTFANLTNLIRLDLSYNSFSGNIPHSLLALPSLLELLAGTINLTIEIQFQLIPSKEMWATFVQPKLQREILWKSRRGV